jgi:hypothetical protein
VRQDGQANNAVDRWLFQGGRLDHESPGGRPHPWHHVLGLTGGDYFSTPAAQPRRLEHGTVRGRSGFSRAGASDYSSGLPECDSLNYQKCNEVAASEKNRSDPFAAGGGLRA